MAHHPEGSLPSSEPSSTDNRKKPTASGKNDGEKDRRIGGERHEKISAEDLNGALLDGALDDVEEDEDDLDGDTEDGGVTNDTAGTPIGDHHSNEGDEEDGELNGVSLVTGSPLDVPGGDSHDGDGDSEGAMTRNEDEENDEDEATPGAHSEDEESEMPEEEETGGGGSRDGEGDEEDENMDDGDDGEGADEVEEEQEEEEEEEEDDDDDHSLTPEVSNKNAPPSSFPQKPTLNRPQLMADEEKDSGDDLSDLSEFDDSDDSDDDDDSGDDDNIRTTTATRSSKAKAADSSTPLNSISNSRLPLGGRKRSLRENSRDAKGRDENMKRETDEENDKGYRENGARHSDKESGSEVAEDEDREEEAKIDEDEDGEEEEDLEKKKIHMDALEALTTIEVDFANLRDKYEQEMKPWTFVIIITYERAYQTNSQAIFFNRMYDERMLELDREVDMINDGTHPELSTLMREIEEKREQRLRVAKAWRTHMGEIAQCEFEIKEYQAHCTYQSKKRTLRTDMVQDLGHKHRKLILELTLSSDDQRKNGVISDKVVLVRARKQRKALANELRDVKEQQGFPASSKLKMVTNAELDEDFDALGLPRPTPQPNSMEHGPPQHAHHYDVFYSGKQRRNHRWASAVEYSQAPGSRAEVEIYVDGSRCNVDGIWYKPNDPVAVLDAAIGQYHAKYLQLANDENLNRSFNNGEEDALKRCIIGRLKATKATKTTAMRRKSQSKAVPYSISTNKIPHARFTLISMKDMI
ncbi:hypothetical protein BGX28_009003 [Mortierella sp. GBA30]|nr:hypothetical protein BGX28_009003 [Mortierella sp. GBA30]